MYAGEEARLGGAEIKKGGGNEGLNKLRKMPGAAA